MMPNNRKKMAISLQVFIILALVILGALNFDKYRMKHEGGKIIRVIEDFKLKQGRLPDSRAEAGLPDTESTQPFYKKISSTDYELFYAIGFDDGYIYYSNTKKWQNYPSNDPGCTTDNYQLFTSPNGKRTARLFRRDCGATTDYSGHVTIDDVPIFVLNHYYGNTIEVEWINDNHLFIQYAYKESPDDVSILRNELNGIKLEYFYWPCIGPVNKQPKGYCME